MLRNLVWGMLVLLLTALPVPGLAQGPPSALSFPGKWWRMPEMSNQLSLSEEEKIKLDAMYLEFHSMLIEARAARDKAQLILDDLLERNELDEKAIFAQLDQANQVLTKMNTDRFRFLVEVRKLLGVDRYTALKGLFMKNRMRFDRKGQKPPAEGPDED